MKRHSRFVAVSAVSIVFCLIVCCGMCRAEKAWDAEILLDGDTKAGFTADWQIAVQLDVIIHNQAIKNDNLCLSYHIYNKEGELLFFEGQRYPLVLDESGTILYYPVTLDLSSYIDTKTVRDAEVRFDIVDEENAYWFSENSNLTVRQASVIFDGHFPARLKTNLSKAIHRPLALLINLAACAFLLFLATIYNSVCKEKVLSGSFVKEDVSSLDRVLYERYFTAPHYCENGRILFISSKNAEMTREFPYTAFFRDKLGWTVMTSTSDEAVKRERREKKVEICLITGYENVLPALRTLTEGAVLAKIFCFDYHCCDYDELMAWAEKAHYRYDARSFDYVFMKRKEALEHLIY